LVTQFQLISGGVDRAGAGVSDTIGLLRRRPEKHEAAARITAAAASEVAQQFQLEDGIAKIAAKLDDENWLAVE
jgi:hypothetical protein